MSIEKTPGEKRQARREKRREQWRTFRRTLPDAINLARPQARLWLLGLGLMMVNRLAGLALPAAPKFLVDEAIPNADLAMLGIIIGIILAATTLQGITSYALTQTISKAGQRLIASLRRKLHDHVTRLSLRYYDDRKTGEIVSRVMNDVEGVRNLVGTGMVEFLGGLISAAFVLVILFWLNWELTVAILAMLSLFVLLMIRSFMVLGPVFKRRQELTGDISGRLSEGISGIRVVKSYRTEEKERSLFSQGVESLLENILKTINTISGVSLATSMLLGLLGSVVLIIGGSQMITGELTTGEFITYILYVGFLIAPLSGVVMIGTQLSEVFAGLDRMKELLAEIPEDKDEAQRKPLEKVNGEIRFEDVEFEYAAGKPVLKGINLEAAPGSVTAVVGPSGSGKSTLIGLVASFYQPTKGRILVDGQDLSQTRLIDYRGFLGCVLQDNFLFAGTVQENIVYSRPDATEEMIHEAARLAHCLEFIERFPDGFKTVIGERGVKLSGGQRQRLAIARAILADPRILILDEATSALDSESEAAIQDGLAALLKGRTTFVIAHRLSTIRHANRILVLEDGRIVEEGTHGELLALKGRYKAMVERQRLAEESQLFLSRADEGATAESLDKSTDNEGAAGRNPDKLSRLLSGE